MNGENPIQAIVASLGQQGHGQAQKQSWSESCDKIIKRIESMNPQDRLAYASCVSDCIYAIMWSMQGWNQWYQMEFSSGMRARKNLTDLTEEQWKDLFKFISRMAVALLNYDKSVSAMVEQRIAKERQNAQNKKSQSKTKNGKKKTSYVA